MPIIIKIFVNCNVSSKLKTGFNFVLLLFHKNKNKNYHFCFVNFSEVGYTTESKTKQFNIKMDLSTIIIYCIFTGDGIIICYKYYSLQGRQIVSAYNRKKNKSASDRMINIIKYKISATHFSHSEFLNFLLITFV